MITRQHAGLCFGHNLGHQAPGLLHSVSMPAGPVIGSTALSFGTCQCKDSTFSDTALYMVRRAAVRSSHIRSHGMRAPERCTCGLAPDQPHYLTGCGVHRGPVRSVGKRITAVRAGAAHSLALSEEGHVYSWGQGTQVGSPQH